MKRTGELLRGEASSQIQDYHTRFNFVKGLYDRFLSNLIRSQFNEEGSEETFQKFFDSNQTHFAGIDGTETCRPLFDMIIFFGGAYASLGTVEIADHGLKVEYSAKMIDEGVGVSSCVPIYINEVLEIDQALINVGRSGEISLDKALDDRGIADNTTISNWLMTFSEFYLAYKLATDQEKGIRIILMDRSLACEQSALVRETSRRTAWPNLAIYEYEVDGVPLDINDLAYARHYIESESARQPTPRGDYLRHAILHLLERRGPRTQKEICSDLRIAEPDRCKRVEKFLANSAKAGFVQESGGRYALADRYKTTWHRVKSLVNQIGEQLFREGGRERPNIMKIPKKGHLQWLTTGDLAFLTLFTLNMLVEECSRRRILLLGITKDTTARDFKRQLIPVCAKNKIWRFEADLEALANAPNTDRMLLQAISLFNHQKLRVPWATIEYDSAFRTIVPDYQGRLGYVSGAIGNRITAERLFVKSYIQLCEARHDPQLRSNVLLVDRLAYPEYDLRTETTATLFHDYAATREPLELVLFRDRNIENRIQDLVMRILVAMSSPNIPEVFGHNRPLFIADNIAKYHNREAREIIDTAGHWIMNRKDLRRFVFYMSTFRERRAQIESTRGHP